MAGQAIVRIKIEGGKITEVGCRKGWGQLAECEPRVEIWDYDNTPNCVDGEGRCFNKVSYDSEGATYDLKSLNDDDIDHIEAR